MGTAFVRGPGGVATCEGEWDDKSTLPKENAGNLANDCFRH